MRLSCNTVQGNVARSYAANCHNKWSLVIVSVPLILFVMDGREGGAHLETGCLRELWPTLAPVIFNVSLHNTFTLKSVTMDWDGVVACCSVIILLILSFSR